MTSERRCQPESWRRGTESELFEDQLRDRLRKNGGGWLLAGGRSAFSTDTAESASIGDADWRGRGETKVPADNGSKSGVRGEGWFSVMVRARFSSARSMACDMVLPCAIGEGFALIRKMIANLSSSASNPS